jgi:hypothetical protein
MARIFYLPRLECPVSRVKVFFNCHASPANGDHTIAAQWLEVRSAFISRLRFIAALLSRFFSTSPQQTVTRAGRAHGTFERFS